MREITCTRHFEFRLLFFAPIIGNRKTCRERRRRIENQKWLGLSVITLGLVVCGAVAQAQQTLKIPRIGYVRGGCPGPPVDAIRQGLRDFGYIEGKNILVEYRYAEGKIDRIPSLVTELVQLKVDVLVSPTGSAILAAKQATKTIPIIMVIVQDPVATGLVDSLARPGGIAFKEYESAAPALKIQLQSLEVRGPNPDLEGAFQSAAKGRANALIVVRSPVLNRYPKRIADLAIKNRLPSMYEGSAWVEAGGLVSYAASEAENYRRAA